MFASRHAGHGPRMTFWAVVLMLGIVAAALSWRASHRAFDDGGRDALGPHESLLGRHSARDGARS